MKKALSRKGCIGVLVGVFAISVLLKVGGFYATKRFIEDSTGFPVPFLRREFIVREEDIGIGAFLRVSPEKAALLIDKGQFGNCDHDPVQSSWGGIYSTREIPADPFPPRDELRLQTGASRWKSWAIYAHPTSGRFWIVVLHPDMGGDPPPGALGE